MVIRSALPSASRWWRRVRLQKGSSGALQSWRALDAEWSADPLGQRPTTRVSVLRPSATHCGRQTERHLV